MWVERSVRRIVLHLPTSFPGSRHGARSPAPSAPRPESPRRRRPVSTLGDVSLRAPLETALPRGTALAGAFRHSSRASFRSHQRGSHGTRPCVPLHVRSRIKRASLLVDAVALDHRARRARSPKPGPGATSIIPSLMVGRFAHILPQTGRARDRRSIRRRCRAAPRRAGAGDLRFLVMRHPTPAARAERRRAAPVGDAAASDASKLTKSTAPASMSRRTPWLVISLWPAVTGMRVAWRTRAIMRRVVVPVARLLEPADVEGLDQPREADRVVRRSSRGWRRPRA